MSKPRTGGQALPPPAGTADETRPRVAMFINSLQRGGAETQFVRVAHALRAAGYGVAIFVLLDENDFGDRLDGIPVHLLAPRPGPRTVANAVRAVRNWRPDVVLSFLYQATIVGRIAARAAGVRVVISSMRNERLESRARTAVYRATTVIDTATVTNSPRAAEVLEATKTVRRGSLRIIPNGVDLSLFDGAAATPTLREELALPTDVFLYLGMGRLAPQKDWPTLIRAIAAYDGPPAHWALAGSGPDRDAICEQIDGAGLGAKITLLGLRDDAVDLLAACDALVLSSRYEGLPNVILEAMASGRPVIATRVGGCAELIGTERGTLVEPGDPAQLAAAMSELASRDPGERAAMGAASRQHVRRHYSLEVADGRWAGLVGELLGSR